MNAYFLKLLLMNDDPFNLVYLCGFQKTNQVQNCCWWNTRKKYYIQKITFIYCISHSSKLHCQMFNFNTAIKIIIISSIS